MHRAFEIDDIIYSVLEHLKFSAMDLVNLAMTCSRLAGPALNILWSKQLSLVPLIMCLPQDTWEISANRTINLSREPTPSEWERLRMNASRVRRLLNDNVGDRLSWPKQHISGHALQRLFEQFPPATLFPNLCALDFETVFRLLESSSKLSLVRKFMSPGLETLWFDVPGGVPTHEVEQFLDALPVEAHGLRQLSISVDHGTTAITVPPSFGKLPKLITLGIHGVDVRLTRQTITNIQQARCLQTLMLSLHGTSYDSGIMALELSSLEHLYLSGNSLPQCTHVLRQLTTRQLSQISVEYSKPASPVEIATLMELLSTSCQNIGSLKRIYVIDATHWKDSELVIPLSSEIFRPLLKFSGLLYVVFIGLGNYNLDDRFVNDIADAWPGIQDLRFASKRRASYNVTFTAMMSLASRCRSLQVLHLTFDATQSTKIPRAQDGTEELWPTQTALWKLHLGHSQVAEVARVPYLLAEVFPTLSDFDWYRDFGISYTDTVMELALLETFQQLMVLQNLLDGNSDEGWESEDSDDDVWMSGA